MCVFCYRRIVMFQRGIVNSSEFNKNLTIVIIIGRNGMPLFSPFIELEDGRAIVTIADFQECRVHLG